MFLIGKPVIDRWFNLRCESGRNQERQEYEDGNPSRAVSGRRFSFHMGNVFDNGNNWILLQTAGDFYWPKDIMRCNNDCISYYLPVLWQDSTVGIWHFSNSIWQEGYRGSPTVGGSELWSNIKFKNRADVKAVRAVGKMKRYGPARRPKGQKSFENDQLAFDGDSHHQSLAPLFTASFLNQGKGGPTLMR